ncbi:hypothetical protein Ct61P_01974 [Colletotrichum tofieldiae]|nr:hypothetical protein Ct61P_01974 [Colletotrichum tofieldiae]
MEISRRSVFFSDTAPIPTFIFPLPVSDERRCTGTRRFGLRALTSFSDGVFLLALCAEEYLPAARLGLEHGANPNEQNVHGESALFWAVACGNRELFDILIDRGADIDMKTTREWSEFTALHRAVEFGRYDMAEVLVERGANLELRSEHNETPLEMAERVGENRIADMIRRRMAPVA